MNFILVLRNPVERAYSAYRYFYKLGIEKLSFEGAIEREQKGKLSGWIEKSNQAYLEHGYYFKQLKQYLSYFPIEKFKILIYEDMILDNINAVKSVFHFLDIDSGFKPNFEIVNLSNEARFRSLNHLFFGNSTFKKITKGIVHKMIPLEKRIQLGNYLREKNIVKSEKIILSKKIYSDLMPIFENDINQLSKLLKIDLFKKWQK